MLEKRYRVKEEGKEGEAYSLVGDAARHDGAVERGNGAGGIDDAFCCVGATCYGCVRGWGGVKFADWAYIELGPGSRGR